MPVIGNHMSRDLLTVAPEDALTEVARRMVDRGVGAVLVLEGSGLAGILTERDVLAAVADGTVAEARVADRMTRNPDTIEAGEPTRLAADLMIHGGFRHLPVLEHGEVVGIVSIRDLMRVVLEDSAPRGA